MKKSPLKTLKLTETEIKALRELKIEVAKFYPGAEFVLFGSKARGDFNEDSDIDVLILLDGDITNKIESGISRIAYDIEFEHAFQVRIGTIVESKKYWDSHIGKIEPFHRNIDAEGIAV
jgi:predicted nucleotidyltransferase